MSRCFDSSKVNKPRDPLSTKAHPCTDLLVPRPVGKDEEPVFEEIYCCGLSACLSRSIVQTTLSGRRL